MKRRATRYTPSANSSKIWLFLLDFGCNVYALIMGASTFPVAFAITAKLPAYSSNSPLHTRHSRTVFRNGTDAEVVGWRTFAKVCGRVFFLSILVAYMFPFCWLFSLKRSCVCVFFLVERFGSFRFCSSAWGVVRLRGWASAPGADRKRDPSFVREFDGGSTRRATVSVHRSRYHSSCSFI